MIFAFVPRYAMPQQHILACLSVSLSATRHTVSKWPT